MSYLLCRCWVVEVEVARASLALLKRHETSFSDDVVQVPVDFVTRARAKKLKKVLSGLIQQVQER